MKNLQKLLSLLIIGACIVVVCVYVFAPQKQAKSAPANNNSIDITEVQTVFADAAKVEKIEESYFSVFNSQNNQIGYALLSSPHSDGITGYAGPTPLIIAIDNNQKIIKVDLLANSETPGFIKNLRRRDFFDSWNGLTISEAIDKKVDAVSGATMSSDAIIKSLQISLAFAAKQEIKSSGIDVVNLLKHACVLLVVVLALICFFVPKTKTLRLITLLLSIAIIGFWRNSLLSIYLFYSWISNGIPLPAQIMLVAIAVLAFVLPFFTGKAFYCMYLCPFGAMQEFAGKLCRKKITIKKTLLTALLILRKIILLAIIVLLALGVSFDLSQVEPFAVFNLSSLSVFMLIFAIVLIIISIFIPKAWCRFLCPTGTLLEAVRNVSVKKKKQHK